VAPGAQTLELQAVKTSDDTGACEAALTGANTIEFAFECENPSTCMASQVDISGTNITDNAGGSALSYSGVSLDFGNSTDGTATFTLSYPDVGQLQLHARLRFKPSGEWMLGASNQFVVRPFALHVTATDNPAATSGSGSVFTSAGTNFTANVTAVLWDADDDIIRDGIADNHSDSNPANNVDLSDNLIALNYGQESFVEQVLLTAALDQPAGGVDPGLSGATNITVFSSGSGASSGVRYDEVGIIELSAAVTDGDYLGIGVPATAAIVGRSGYVGRFNPARYAATLTNIVPACGATFTYSRQSFNGSMTMEAQNGTAGGNVRTANYRAGFVTLDPTTELVFVNDQTAAAYQLQTAAFTQDFDTVTTGEAQLALQFRWDMPQQAPTVSTPQLTGITDEVTTLAGAPVDIGSTAVRYGRVTVNTAAGSELLNLGVPMRAEYYLNSSTEFVTNTTDSCTSGVTLGLSDFADNLILGETCVVDTGSPGDSSAGCAVAGVAAQLFNGPPISGDFNLFLQAPGAGNDGSVTVDAVVPDWLKFDWDTGVAGDENPSGRVTFGIFGGDESQVYRRELY
jgi:MSHA biogenesis protein MshQ